MEHFDQLVREQLETMEQLLFLQSEIERCKMLEAELSTLQHETKRQTIHEEIERMKQQLAEIQRLFEQQTEEVIRAYKCEVKEPSS